VRQEGDTLAIENGAGELRLRVPPATTAVLERLDGTLTVRGIQSLSVDRIDGDVVVEEIGGEVHLRDLDAGLRAAHVQSLQVEDGPQPDRRVKNVIVDDAGAVQIDNVDGDCTVRNVAGSFRCNNIGGNLTLTGNDQTAVVGANVGRALEVAGARSLHIANVGTHAVVRAVGGDVRLGNIGANCAVDEVGGNLALVNVGGSLTIRRVGGVDRIGNIGGNLTLHAAPLATGSIPHDGLRITVGGNARIELPDAANIRIEAMVGGAIRAERGFISGPGKSTVVFGDGSARLHIVAGGNVELHGGGVPRAVDGAWSGPEGFGAQFRDFGAQFGELGASFGSMGADIGRAVSQAFAGIGPEVSRAVAEAWEPWARSRANPTTSSHRPAGDPARSPSAATGATERLDPDRQAAREAVLRMVATGRITPDEGASLLDALG
jgi:hypothetical protein